MENASQLAHNRALWFPRCGGIASTVENDTNKRVADYLDGQDMATLKMVQLDPLAVYWQLGPNMVDMTK